MNAPINFGFKPRKQPNNALNNAFNNGNAPFFEASDDEDLAV